MIKRESFIKMMNLAENYTKEIDRWVDFGFEIYEMPICDIPWGMFNCWMDDHFDLDGKDWINWYLWERISIVTKEVLPCYDEDGKEFYINNPSDLWNLIEKYRLKPCADKTCPLNDNK